MRRTSRHLLVLSGAVALLALAVWAEIARESAARPQPLTALDPAAIRRIEIRCGACQTRRFERDTDGWRMREPYALRADPGAIQRLLVLAHAPIRARLEAHDYDPAKLGLAPAAITVTFDDVTIEIGGEDPIEHDRYVRVGGELVRVPDRFSARLLEAPESEVVDPKAIPEK